MQTKDARSLPAVAQEDLRRKAVRAVREEHRPKVEVCRLFGVSRQALDNWLERFAAGGETALAAQRRGRPPTGGRLSPRQQAQLARQVVDRCPDQIHLPFCLWTRAAVATLIERRCRVRVSVWTAGRYLARWGFTPQKPLRRAFEQDPEAVRRWLAEEYPALRRAARRAGAEIYWGDEMGLRSDHQTGTSYGLKGRTPAIPGTGQRFRCNMLSALTNRGRLFFLVFRERFTARVFLNFLRRLVRQVGRRIFLIVDRHPVHKSRLVTRWRQAHQQELRLFFLPPYSPELNPDECVNQDVKSNAVGRKRARNQREMIGAVRSYLRRRQKRPAVVRRYFDEEHVRYAAS
jgi:transposase